MTVVHAHARQLREKIISNRRKYATDDPAAGILHWRPTIDSFDSRKAYDQIKSWISECSHPEAAKDGCLVHPHCKAIEPKILPKRVLDVGSTDQDPFPVAPEPGTCGIYVTLSYCWGTRQPVTLTQASLDNGLPSFPIQDLPTTLQDAITICRNLNFQYLWIDALCIIQDSLHGEDWVTESGKMDSIYGNAALTIAASGAKDTSEGMLQKASAFIQRKTCSVPFHLLDGRVGNAVVQFYPHGSPQLQPLNNRAWTLQEHIMSARILSYQTDQLVWECRTMRKHANNPSHFLMRNLTLYWQDIVAEFTRRCLTVSSDRLAALSAGLWSDNLPDDLLWRAVSYPHLPRPTLYRTPTWSWGSIDTEVHFVKSGRVESTAETELLDFSIATPPSYLCLWGCIKPAAGIAVLPPRILRFPLVAITVDFNTGPPGSSQGHSLYVINFDCLDDAEKAASYVNLPQHSVGYFNYLGGLTPQWLPEAKKVDHGRLTELYPLWFLKVTETQALVLVPYSEDGLEVSGNAYKRVGILTVIYESLGNYGTWFDNVKEKSTITLI